MEYDKKLLSLKEGSRLQINKILLKVNRIESEVNVNRNVPNIKIKDAGKVLFLLDKDEKNEYRLWVPIKSEKLILEKIKRKSISTPWEYEILETHPVSKIEFL
jgi:hypothetical protein